MSKFSLKVLNQIVYPHLQSSDPDVILGATFGEDVSLTRVQEGILVSHVDPIVGAVDGIGWLAVHVACNDVATSGAKPRWILALVLVPQKEDLTLLEEIMQDIGKASEEIGVTVIGGHSGYSNNLSRPLVSVTALGTLTEQEPILTGGAQIGDHIIVTKGVGLEGTAILASDFEDIARELGITSQEIAAARNIMGSVSVIPESMQLAKIGATAMHDVTRGGILETLSEIAHLSHNAIQMDYDAVPIPEIVQRFASAFDFDPLKMISSGTLVATVPPEKLKSAKEALLSQGILFADVGQVADGTGVTIHRKGQLHHYKEIHPEEDELARLWEKFPR